MWYRRLTALLPSTVAPAAESFAAALDGWLASADPCRLRRLAATVQAAASIAVGLAAGAALVAGVAVVVGAEIVGAW